jgi:hypothetical protein
MEGLRRGLGAPVGRARGGPARGRGNASDDGAGGDDVEGGGEAMVLQLVRDKARWCGRDRLLDAVRIGKCRCA